MSKVSATSDLGKIKDLNTFIRFCAAAVNELVNAVNGKIEFDTNFKSQTVSVTFTAANSDTLVSHNLNKVGVKYIVAKKNAACDVFNGSKASTTGAIYLQSTVATTVTLILC